MSEPEAYVQEKLSGPQVLGGGRRRKSRVKKSRKSRGKRTRGGANPLVGSPITGGYKRRKSSKSRRNRK